MTDILIIEDNQDIAPLLCDFLKREGYSCHHTISGEDGLSYLKTHEVRLVLLDIMLPGIDGFQVCRDIHQHRNIPMIILSAKNQKDDKLTGLNLGADDYIEKPYDIDLLLARVNALYRRHYQENADVRLRVGPFLIDTAERRAYYQEQPLTLTVKEYDLLLLLLKNRGKTLRKEYIFDTIWGVDNFSEPATLTVHIKWLREKIESDPKHPHHIQTVWGVGYKFIV